MRPPVYPISNGTDQAKTHQERGQLGGHKQVVLVRASFHSIRVETGHLALQRLQSYQHVEQSALRAAMM